MARPLHLKGKIHTPQHINWCTRARHAFFDDPPLARRCLEAVEKERARLHLDVYAYALMPDHIHLIIGASPWSCGDLVKWMKLCTAFWLRYEGYLKGTPWARGYWDRAIGSDAELRQAVRYVHANPVKAGLAPTLKDYPFTSFRCYHELEEGLIRVTAAW